MPKYENDIFNFLVFQRPGHDTICSSFSLFLNFLFFQKKFLNTVTDDDDDDEQVD